EWKVAIVKAQGSISLPEMAVLYRNYNNKVVPVVAGALSSDIVLSGSPGAKKTKKSWVDEGVKYDGFEVDPGSGTSLTMTLMGKDKDGKSKSYAVVKYKVKPFPKPEVLDPSIKKSSGARITLVLKDSPLKANFNVTGGELTVGNDAPVSFSGSVIPASAVQKAKAGAKVVVIVKYNGTGGASSKEFAFTVKP
ncbi:MAG: hypothetical protein NWQ65_01015, partial [Crocinitomicaceae bacterium]|nr:hypothetical protein [Crocinitomicaceae bacterium]